MKNGFALRRGARGFLVGRLQSGLGVTPLDGVYGARTEAAVIALQKAHGLGDSGDADPTTVAACGLSWPDEFERCMNLTSVLEGTSFGDCNSTDIDGAGLTLGVAGFTTAHGEVQEILRRYVHERADVLAQVAPLLRESFSDLLGQTAVNAAKGRELFYGNGATVLVEWRRTFRAWGDDRTMQMIQLEYARGRFWIPAQRSAKRLGLDTLAGRALLLDIGVQNGGWASRHQRVYDQRFSGEDHAGESVRLERIAQSVAWCAHPRWRADVLARKRLFARGRGLFMANSLT